jgi:hypothetical protein
MSRSKNYPKERKFDNATSTMIKARLREGKVCFFSDEEVEFYCCMKDNMARMNEAVTS